MHNHWAVSLNLILAGSHLDTVPESKLAVGWPHLTFTDAGWGRRALSARFGQFMSAPDQALLGTNMARSRRKISQLLPDESCLRALPQEAGEILISSKPKPLGITLQGWNRVPHSYQVGRRSTLPSHRPRESRWGKGSPDLPCCSQHLSFEMSLSHSSALTGLGFLSDY